jgi:hypothetical protein
MTIPFGVASLRIALLRRLAVRTGSRPERQPHPPEMRAHVERVSLRRACVPGRGRARTDRRRRHRRAERPRARGARAWSPRHEQRADRRAAVAEHPHSWAPPPERLREAAAGRQARARRRRRTRSHGRSNRLRRFLDRNQPPPLERNARGTWAKSQRSPRWRKMWRSARAHRTARAGSIRLSSRGTAAESGRRGGDPRRTRRAADPSCAVRSAVMERSA